MEELDLKDLLKIFRDKFKIIVIVVLISLILGVVYTFKFVTPKYKSSTSLILGKNEANSSVQSDSITQSDVVLNQKLVATYSELLKSYDIVSEVIKNLNLDMDINKLASNISIVSVNNTEVIKISVVDKNPEQAQKIAAEITNVFTKKVQDIYNINNVNIVDDAQIPTMPYNINHMKDIGIFGAAGLVIAVIIILICNSLDDTIKSAKDVEENLNLVVLATLPDTKKLKTKN